MSDLAQGVFDYGMERGILSDIKSLTKNLGLSKEQAMAALDIPESERQKFRDMLKNSNQDSAD